MLVKEGIHDIHRYPGHTPDIIRLIKDLNGKTADDPTLLWEDLTEADFRGYSSVNTTTTTGETEDGWQQQTYQPAIFQFNPGSSGADTNEIVAWAITGSSGELHYVETFDPAITMQEDALAIEIFLAVQYGDDVNGS